VGFEDRFWGRVDKRQDEGCWLWTSHCNKGGYGKLGSKLAHRIAWELTYGPIHTGLDVCHHCDNPKCVNPSHLFMGTARDNIRDCISKGRFADHKGEANPRAKLTEALALEIRETNLPQRKLASLFQVSKGTIYYIQKGMTWQGIQGRK